MDSKEVEERFFQLATPDLIRKWIKKFGIINLSIPNDINNQFENCNKFCTGKIKKTQFVEQGEIVDCKRKIQMIRGASNLEPIKVDSTYDERRGSLQTMRQFNSLPSTTSNNLASLINSKITLPKFLQDENHLKCLRETNWTEFFVEIVSGVLSDFDYQSVINKIRTNMGILTYSDHCVMHINDKLVGSSNFSPEIVNYFLQISRKCRKENKPQKYQNDEVPECLHSSGIGELLCISLHLKSHDSVRPPKLSAALILINPTSSKNVLQHLNQFTQCCVKGLYNATLFETYSSEFSRNKVLLESLHELYEEQNSLEKFMKKSVHKMKEIIKCEEVAVFLLDVCAEKPSNFGFHCTLNTENKFSLTSEKIGSRKIAKMVCINGESFKCKSEEKLDELKEIGISSMICKPIWDSSNHVIGAAQVINKLERDFSKNDEDIMEVCLENFTVLIVDLDWQKFRNRCIKTKALILFTQLFIMNSSETERFKITAITIFCTVGITNCRLYEDMTKSNARAQVALEALSYHTTASLTEVHHIMEKPIPSFSTSQLGSHKFNDFSLSNEEMVLATVKLFIDLKILTLFTIKQETLYKWVITVMKNYRNVAYHNWCHAFNVFHMMIYILHKKSVTQVLLDIEILGLIVGCLCHDLDHRGTNNNFQIKTDSPLAQLYGNQATLEQHHFNLTVMIMNNDGNNIFESLTTDQYSTLMTIIKQSILATDLSNHFKTREKFFSEVENQNCDWRSAEQRKLLRDALMTSCDLAAATKQWPVAQKAAILVMEEFFQQGDVEKNIYKIQPQHMMDRSCQDELPEIQIQWITSVCEPLFRHLTMVDKQFQEMYDQLMENVVHWTELKSKPEIS